MALLLLGLATVLFVGHQLDILTTQISNGMSRFPTLAFHLV